MSQHIYRCPACSAYTMQEACPNCKEKTERPLPPKYSIPDKFGAYRREARKKELQEKGLW